MKAKIRWMTNASFQISACNTSIVTDPCLLQSSYKGFTRPFFGQVDYVALSHLHWDHVTELKDVLQDFSPAVFTGVQGSERLAEYLDMNTSFLFPMYPDQELDMGEFSVKAFYNRHANVKLPYSQQEKKCQSYDFMPQYPGLERLQGIGGLEMYSYLFTFQNGFKVLFWGGNISRNQMTTLRGIKPDVALMQFSKQSTQGLCDLATAIEPKVLIPHHHDLKTPLSEAQPRLEELKALYPGRLVCPRNGETVEF